MSQIATIVSSKSHKWFDRARNVIPGGVNSPARACTAVHAEPVFFSAADGATMSDVDGNVYIDYVGSWGALILGHRYPRVMEALEGALLRGTSYGAPCPGEVEMAELICGLMPALEMVRMVNSGTEATMSAVRLARAFTKRSIIVKFEGCYHGHADSFLSGAGSGLATLGISSSPGVPAEVAALTVTLPFNDLGSVEKAFKEHKEAIAAVIVEPIVGNAGVILPENGFLPGLRELATKHGALLIFDEVMTGFRVAMGGAQGKYAIKPDLTCLGKIIGAGLPVGAYGGRKEIMAMVAPAGPVYQAGTLSGNPLAMAAGLAQLRTLQTFNLHERIDQLTRQLADGISELGKKNKVPLVVNQTTGMLSVFFHKGPVTDFAGANKSDTEKFAQVWQALSRNGIYWPPSQFESAFVSAVHTRADIETTLAAFEEALHG